MRGWTHGGQHVGTRVQKVRRASGLAVRKGGSEEAEAGVAGAQRRLRQQAVDALTAAGIEQKVRRRLLEGVEQGLKFRDFREVHTSLIRVLQELTEAEEQRGLPAQYLAKFKEDIRSTLNNAMSAGCLTCRYTLGWPPPRGASLGIQK